MYCEQKTPTSDFNISDAMEKAIHLTNYRRKLQNNYNKKN
jgi:excinuclease UvrABC helicase subunit UvrB